MNQTTQYDRTTINSWSEGKREAFDETIMRERFQDLLEDEFWEICGDVWEYTCLSLPALYNLYSACTYVAQKNIPGDIVECGVFFGGSIMMAAHTMERAQALKNHRVVGIDTFTGFVKRSDHDISFSGKEICKPNKHAHDFYDNANANIRSVPCDQSRVEVVRGDVFQVLTPTIKDRQIAILRLDTDSYDTTKFELEAAWDHVSPGGIVIIDDYGYCLGARKATDDFFKDRKVYLNRVNAWTRSIMKL